MLTVSTYFHPGAGGFFAFVMLNAIGQAIAGSYLQTSVIAVASLFGPTAMQALMSGQAAVAVAVSGVTVVSSALSLREKPSPQALADSEPEAKAAFMFFGLSTLFYLVSAGAHIWLTRLPAYHNILAQFEHTVDVAHDEHSLKKREQLIRVAKSNVIFNFAVAYVFIITLVSPSKWRRWKLLKLSCSPYSLLSLSPSSPRTQQPTRYSSALSTSSSSTLETLAVASCAVSLALSYGRASDYSHYHLRAPSSSQYSSCATFNVLQPRQILEPSSAPTSSLCSYCWPLA